MSLLIAGEVGLDGLYWSLPTQTNPILWFCCRSQGHGMISVMDRSDYSNCNFRCFSYMKRKKDTSKKCQCHRSLLRQSLNSYVVLCTLETFVKWLVSNSNHLFWIIPVMQILAYLLLKSHWNELHSLGFDKSQKKLDSKLYHFIFRDMFLFNILY